MTTQPDRMQPFGVLRLSLVAAAVVLAAASWLFGGSIGFCKIHDGRHQELTVEIGDFESALGAEVTALCATQSIRNVYFDHWDVALPGILNAVGKNPRCQVVRETPITPLTVDAIAQCSAVIVKEKHLAWNHAGVYQWELGSAASQVSRIAQWRSSEDQFGFDIYRKTGCSPLTQHIVLPQVSRVSWSLP